MEDKKWKLNYKIKEKKSRMVQITEQGQAIEVEDVFVEWTHDDGPVDDCLLLPVSHPPIHASMPRDIQYKEFVVGTRAVIPDMITVRAGTPTSIVMQMLEEKRERLAHNLGVEP